MAVRPGVIEVVDRKEQHSAELVVAANSMEAP